VSLQTIMMPRWTWVLLGFALSQTNAQEAPPAKDLPGTVRFVTHRVGNFRSEACCVADFNGDKKPDIAAGEYLYLGPDWKPVKIRTNGGEVDQTGKGYRWDFANIPIDVDGDGLPDLVSVDWFEKRSVWCKNTGTAGGEWPVSLIHSNGNFECADIWDIAGKGQKTAVVPAVAHTIWHELVTGADGKRTWATHTVSNNPMAWGVGVGDLNADGRPDILRPNGWFEAPADIRKDQWILHPLSLGGKDGAADHTAQILVHDVNGDRLPDIITSNAHKYGIFWYEQYREGGEIRFEQHTIDDSWSQAHSLALGDLDGDGTAELVTGKRFMAHNGSDPDENGPLGVYYYKIERRADQPIAWSKHIISHNEGIGAGIGLCLDDLNADGKLDVVVTGKWGGPVWFENRGK
jgi:hypothetical protein